MILLSRSIQRAEPPRRRTPLTKLLLLLLPIACSGPPELPPDVLARWDGGEIRRAELDDYVLSLPPKRREPADGEDLATWRRGLLRQLAAQRLLIASEEAKIGEHPRVEDYLDAQRQSILADAVAAEILATVTPPSEDEARAFFDQHRGRFRRQELLNLRHIYLRFRDDDDDAERTRRLALMEDLRRRALTGEDFGSLAREHSESANSEEGGIMNLFARGHSFPAFEEAAFELAEGGTSEVFTSPRGAHLIRLETRLPETIQTFDQARESIHTALGQQSGEAALARAQAELAGDQPAEIHPELLNSEATPDPATVLARVGELQLDFDRFQTLHPRWREMTQTPKLEEILAGYLRQMIFVKEAERRQFDQLPAVTARIRTARDRSLLGRAQQAAVAAHGSNLTNDQLRGFFDDHPNLFQTPRKIQASRIFLPCEPERIYPTFQRAEELVRQLRAGEDFKTLAREYSTEQLAAGGGQLPPLAKQGLAAQGKEFYNAVTKLAIGEISEPVLVPHNILAKGQAAHLVGGLLIVRVDAIEEPRELDFGEALERARELYLRKFQQRVLRQAEDEMLTRAGFELNDDALTGA